MLNDQSLGMDQGISRRHFINGTAVALGALATEPLMAVADKAGGGAVNRISDPSYPPSKVGMRGSHPGSFEFAHMLRDGQLDVKDVEATGETYDCVIVGGGLSGLSAAHFFLKNMGGEARILILDNHDDFGGHAKRNEFNVDGRLMAVNGGTLNIENPERYNRWARQILEDMEVDLDRYERANATNGTLYQRMGLRRGTFLDKQQWKKDQLIVPAEGKTIVDYPSTLSPKARADFKRLLSDERTDYLAGKTVDEKKQLLATTSMADYYLNFVKLDPEVVWFFRTYGHASFCVGADATPALYGWVQGMPGFAGLGLGKVPDGLFADLPGGQHGRQKEGGHSVHFPDGNATLARLMVSRLVPASTAARTQEEMGTARIDYAKLDLTGQSTRIRLSSIVVNVRHDGDPWTAKEAIVTYVNGGKLKSVRAKAVIMASWNMMLPYVLPELPQAQKDALAYGVKGPLVYTNVAVRNWRAWDKLKLSAVECPGMFHETMELTEAASLGGLHHPQSSDEPMIVHFVKTMAVPGLPRRDQHRAGRQQLLEISFEEFERETRSQMARILGPGGFDPARDIAAITVNRWPHGYAYTYNSLYDPVEWVYTETPSRPCVVGRQPFGLISIANSDAAASPHTDAAMQEGHRAAQERSERLTFPFTKG